jgi:putative nucleotidyltransferase with HDIG domain
VSRPLGAEVAPLAPLGDGAWAVGGGIRDALLGRPVADLDVAVADRPAERARDLAKAHDARRFRLSASFGSWRVFGGRLPFPVDLTPLQGPTLEADLARRDLTVNALATPVAGPGAGEVVDRHGGVADLAARRLRLVSPEALANDPVRMLRLARLALQLGFAVDPEAVRRARADAPLLADAVGERLRDELGRLLRLPEAWRGVELLDEIGALGALVPELEESRGLEQSPYHHKDVLGHTLEVVRHASEMLADPEPVFRSLAPRVAETLARPLADDLTAGQAMLYAALLHDMAKPATRAVTPEGRVTFMGHDRLGAEMVDALFRRLRTSTRLREFVVLLVRQHLPLGFMVHREPLSLRQIDRYLRRTAPAEIEVIVLTVADRLATAGPMTRPSAITRHLALARQVAGVHFDLVDRGPIRPLVPGDALARAAGRPPGPWLTELLAALREEQLVGAVRSAEEAEEFARRWVPSDRSSF